MTDREIDKQVEALQKLAKEIKLDPQRGFEVLKVIGLLDEQNNLTEHGKNVYKAIQENPGHIHSSIK